jgi:hypothetical protein
LSTIANYIVELLNDDMVSHGLLLQCVDQSEGIGESSQLNWKGILAELLLGDVEIGVAEKVSDNYVEFIAWRGSSGERIGRATNSVNNAIGADREFAYWLCLRKNVDRYEEPKQE